MIPEKLASILYENYCEQVGGKAFNGDPLPSWADFSADPDKQVQVSAWINTAQAAIDETSIRHIETVEERLSDVLSTYASGIVPPKGRAIQKVVSYIDTAKDTVIFKIFTSPES